MAKKIFVDTNPLIYLVGKVEPYYDKVLKFFADSISENAEFYTSTITDAEFLVRPFRENNTEQVERYLSFLNRMRFLKCFISETIAKRAAQIRAKHKDIKLADSLQVAASLDCGCDFFLTNDKRLKIVSEINIMRFDDA